MCVWWVLQGRGVHHLPQVLGEPPSAQIVELRRSVSTVEAEIHEQAEVLRAVIRKREEELRAAELRAAASSKKTSSKKKKLDLSFSKMLV